MPNKKAKERKWQKRKLNEQLKKFGRTKKQIKKFKRRQKIREQKWEEREQLQLQYSKRKW
jgi:ribosome-binding ATPase YchF (GTP1/OBG family)